MYIRVIYPCICHALNVVSSVSRSLAWSRSFDDTNPPTGDDWLIRHCDMEDLLSEGRSVDIDTQDPGEPSRKRKRNRFKATCQPCQRSKSKCIRPAEGEGSEVCQRCQTRGEVCTYDEIALPVKADPQILRMLRAHEERIKKLEEALRRVSPPQLDAAASADKPVALKPKSDKEDLLETEDAAQALEGIALGQQQYNALGLNKELPTRAGSPDPSASVLPPVGSWTSIFDPTSSEACALHYLHAMPPIPVCDAMVELFFRE